MISFQSSQVKFETGFEVIEDAALDVDLERPHFGIIYRGCCRPLSFTEPFYFEDRRVGRKWKSRINLTKCRHLQTANFFYNFAI